MREVNEINDMSSVININMCGDCVSCTRPMKIPFKLPTEKPVSKKCSFRCIEQPRQTATSAACKTSNNKEKKQIGKIQPKKNRSRRQTGVSYKLLSELKFSSERFSFSTLLFLYLSTNGFFRIFLWP